MSPVPRKAREKEYGFDGYCSLTPFLSCIYSTAIRNRRLTRRRLDGLSSSYACINWGVIRHFGFFCRLINSETSFQTRDHAEEVGGKWVGPSKFSFVVDCLVERRKSFSIVSVQVISLASTAAYCGLFGWRIIWRYGRIATPSNWLSARIK